jgi:hypothetical protein
MLQALRKTLIRTRQFLGDALTWRQPQRQYPSADVEASGEQRGEGSLGRTGGAKAYDESGLSIVGVIARRFR